MTDKFKRPLKKHERHNYNLYHIPNDLFMKYVDLFGEDTLMNQEISSVVVSYMEAKIAHHMKEMSKC